MAVGMLSWLVAMVLVVAMVTAAPTTNDDKREVELRMPGVQPQEVSTEDYSYLLIYRLSYCIKIPPIHALKMFTFYRVLFFKKLVTWSCNFLM